MCSPLSLSFFFFPSASTEDMVPVSCHGESGSLIKQTTRCHRSLGRVRSPSRWLLPQTPAPGGPSPGERAWHTAGWRCPAPPPRPRVLVGRGTAARREAMETFNFHRACLSSSILNHFNGRLRIYKLMLEDILSVFINILNQKFGLIALGR